MTVGEQPSAIVTAYTSGERLFIPNAVDDPRGLTPDRRGDRRRLTAPRAGHPAGRGVGVLVVLWRRHVAGPDDFSAMATTLLATEAGVAVERPDLLLQLDEMARTDKLTGLRNRRAFDELLEREMARSKRTGELLTLALIDLDRFKVGSAAVPPSCKRGGASGAAPRCCRVATS